MRAGNYLKYGLRDTLRSLWRHKAMVLVTVLTVAITFIVLGSAVLLSLNSQHMESYLENQMEIVAFLRDDVSREDALALEGKLETVKGFSECTFVPKEEALESMGDKFGGETGLTNALGGVNPLPDAYHVKVVSLEDMEAAAKEIEAMDGVEMVRYGQETVNNMSKVSGALWAACIGVIGAMIVAALLLVNSTIRLTVSARSEEIAIMKYIGATNFYVRVPFFLEGLILGLVGAGLAFAAIYFGYGSIVRYISENITFLPIITDGKVAVRIGLWLLLGGAVLGSVGSNIAVKKYLRV